MKRALTSSTSTKRWVEKIQARVFCPETEGLGGNPVTIFAPLDIEEDDHHDTNHDDPTINILSPEIQAQLARTCSWESVMVNPILTTTNSSNSTTRMTPQKQLSFYMPTGHEVSFCAHAAMAGAIRVADELEQETALHCRMLMDEDDTNKNNKNTSQSLSSSPSYSATVHADDIVTLHISHAPYTQTPVSEPALLYRILREHCHLQLPDLEIPEEFVEQVPTFVHASVARPKTLVFVRNLTILNTICQAPDNPQLFQRALRALDNTTGLYIYAPHPDLDGAYACRQFPIASGYPEDPATGIAAAALAAALDRDLPYMKIFQGDALGKPSLLLVEDLVKKTSSSGKEEEDTEEEPPTATEPDNKTNNNDDDDGAEPYEPRASTYHDIQSISMPQAETATVSYKLLGKMEIDETEEICIDDL